MTTTIRRFRLAYIEYRHVIDLKTDAVFLQRLKDENEFSGGDSFCVNLLRFDSHCDVWTMDGKRVGHFRTRDGYWEFVDDKETVRCESEIFPESLLDSEVTISKRWLAAQP